MNSSIKYCTQEIFIADYNFNNFIIIMIIAAVDVDWNWVAGKLSKDSKVVTLAKLIFDSCNSLLPMATSFFIH